MISPMSLDRKFHSYQQVVGTNAIPLAMDKRIITKQHSPAISNVTLTVTDTKSDKQLALKPYRQSAHPSEEKLLQLITNADAF